MVRLPVSTIDSSLINNVDDQLDAPVPVAAGSKAWICRRSSAEIVGSNPTGGIDVCLLCLLCVVR